MEFTLIGPWNCPCKAIVLPLIGVTWGLHLSAHETVHVQPKPLFCHTLALHGVYIGRLMELPIWTTVLSHIGITWGLLWLAHQTAKSHCFSTHGHCMRFTLVDSWNCPYKPLSYHTLVLHGSTLVGPWSCPCKTIVLPLSDIAWDSNWLAHETAHVKPLFYQTMALHGLHIVGPWNCNV